MAFPPTLLGCRPGYWRLLRWDNSAHHRGGTPLSPLGRNHQTILCARVELSVHRLIISVLDRLGSWNWFLELVPEKLGNSEILDLLSEQEHAVRRQGNRNRMLPDECREELGSALDLGAADK